MRNAGSFGRPRGATKGDRGVRSSTVHVVENAAAREHRPERFSSPSKNDGDREQAGPKLDGRRQTRIDLGSYLLPYLQLDRDRKEAGQCVDAEVQYGIGRA